jgi:hypothetical protein
MTHSARPPASLLRDGLQTLENRRQSGAAPEDPDYLLLGQNPDRAGAARPQHPAQGPAPSHSSQATESTPARQDVLNYLGELAKDYHLPPKLVYAVADAESSVDPAKERQKNYLMRNGKYVHDKTGQRIIASYDYGLMQINDKTWFGKTVKVPHMPPLKIDEEVTHDWRANARAGVAILARQYDMAEVEQGPGATATDRAQQSYSGYSHGERKRDLYLKEKPDGQPKYDKDRNSLAKYLRWSGEQ